VNPIAIVAHTPRAWDTRTPRPFFGLSPAELTPRHPHTVAIVYSLHEREYTVAVDGTAWGGCKRRADAEELRREIDADLQERFIRQRRQRRARPWLLNGPQAPHYIYQSVFRNR
jgi:hypothetical protein